MAIAARLRAVLNHCTNCSLSLWERAGVSFFANEFAPTPILRHRTLGWASAPYTANRRNVSLVTLPAAFNGIASTTWARRGTL